MKFILEHKPKTHFSDEAYLVLDTTNPHHKNSPLYSGYLGRVVAECPSKEDGQFVVNALNSYTSPTKDK